MTEKSYESYESKIKNMRSNALFCRIESVCLGIASIAPIAHVVDQVVKDEAFGQEEFIAVGIGLLLAAGSSLLNGKAQEYTQVIASLESQKIIDSVQSQQTPQAPIQ
jgi:hypothetical protein